MALLPKCSRVTKREVKALALTTVTLTSRSTKSLRLQLPFKTESSLHEPWHKRAKTRSNYRNKQRKIPHR